MAATVATIVGFAASVQAVPITGGISLAGAYTVNTGDINTATALTSFSAVTVDSRAGSYIAAGVALGTGVTMTPFVFSPFPVAGLTPLWFTIAGPAASFDLASPIGVTQPGDGSLKLTGVGILHLFGYDDTPGQWLFTANSLGGTFTFSSSNGSIPDGGTTVLLLGVALTGLFLVRKQVLA